MGNGTLADDRTGAGRRFPASVKHTRFFRLPLIERYLITAVARPLLAILGICMALFASYGAADLMGDVANGLLATNSIATMIGLRLLIALEVLMPVALYLSIVLSFGALYANSEFTVMWALCVTPWRVLRAVLVPAGACALLVAFLSLAVRPWAYEHLHTLAYRSTLSLNTDALRGGTFYVIHGGNRVIHVEGRMRAEGPARHVFVMDKKDDRSLRVVSAETGYALPPNGKSGTLVRLEQTHVYEIALAPDASDRILSSTVDTVDPTAHETEDPQLNAAATPTLALLRSKNLADISELQWRFSTGISTLLLSIIAIALSGGRPRQTRYGRVGLAMVVYFTYYFLVTAMRTWLQHGQIGAFPGVWLAVLLLALGAAFSFSRVIRGRR